MRETFTYLGRLFVSICVAVLVSGCAEGCGSMGSVVQNARPAGESGGQPSEPDHLAGSPRSSDSDRLSGSPRSSDSVRLSGNPRSSDSDRLAGSLRISGSTSMDKLSSAWAESFMEKYPEVKVTVEFTGSSAGIEAVLSGDADIGNSSRSLKPDEEADGAVGNPVAADGIVICVDPSNRIAGLTSRQLIDIYCGTVMNWSELGGSDIPVVVVGREAGSGTRGVFEEILGVEDGCAYANELDSTGAVMARVATTPGAIGYVSLDVADDSVRLLPLDGVEPSAENIRNGCYCLSRPFVMVTRGEIAEQNELVRIWFEYVYSEEGQAVAEQLGFVRVR